MNQQYSLMQVDPVPEVPQHRPELERAVHHQRGRLPRLADCYRVDGVGRARLLGAVAPCSVGGET